MDAHGKHERALDDTASDAKHVVGVCDVGADLCALLLFANVLHVTVIRERRAVAFAK